MSAGARVRVLLPWIGAAALIVVADQLSKGWILGLMSAPGEAIALTGYFNLVLSFNRGAAFSFLSDASGWQSTLFLGIGLAASVFIASLLARNTQRRLFASALALVLGGALGNVVDRLRYGQVVDFLDFHWRVLEPIFPGGHFPAFNLADSAICCGAALLILDEILRARGEAAAPKHGQERSTGSADQA